MLADCPTRYYQNPDCTEFISKVPVTWDETKCLDAKIGKYVIVAKRHGDKWYVAGICNGEEKTREFHLPLDFLGAGQHKMTIFTDGINADYQAMDYRKNIRQVDSTTTLDIKMVRNGGFTAVIE